MIPVLGSTDAGGSLNRRRLLQWSSAAAATLGASAGHAAVRPAANPAVEQNVVAALSFAHRVYVVNNGHVAWQGTPAALQADPALMKTHLGV